MDGINGKVSWTKKVLKWIVLYILKLAGRHLTVLELLFERYNYKAKKQKYSKLDMINKVTEWLIFYLMRISNLGFK